MRVASMEAMESADSDRNEVAGANPATPLSTQAAEKRECGNFMV
jgi:hypothetical protein